MRTLKAKLAAFAATLAFGGSTFASVVVYDNSLNYQDRFYPLENNLGVGDEIFLDGTERLVTDFRFELYLAPGASGNETVTVFFHLNDGLPPGDSPRKAPGTVLWEETIALDEGHRTYQFVPNTSVPGNFTWSVVVNGLEAGEQAGPVLYGPPEIGLAYDDLWRHTGTEWELVQVENGAVYSALGARITAVPEPSTYALAALGLALAGIVGYRRRSS